jgi:tetratricopeptide (TPR) repeat protein
MFVKGTRAVIESLPGASALNELMSAEEMEAHIGKIYSIVGRKEGDFWMKPEEDLTDFLVADMNAWCDSQRLVLLADTYELMGAFDEWLRERVFANLGEHALLVIAGRNRLEGKGWQEFAPLMRQHELYPFDASESDVYLQRKGINDENLIVEMSDYAGGHPLTLALLADLADQLKAGDLARAPERRDIIRTLLERITHNITTSLRAALEVCAILRVVNQDSLTWMLKEHTPPPTDEYTNLEAGMQALLAQMGRNHPRYDEALVYEQRLRENINQTRRYGDDPSQENDRAEVLDQLNRLTHEVSSMSFNDLCRRYAPPPAPPAASVLENTSVQDVFEELRCFDFVKVRSDGLALHDTVWEAMNEELRWRSPTHYRAMNAKAAQYYEHLLAQPNVQQHERLILERLYHRIRTDETDGIGLFQEMAEELTRYDFLDKLGELLNEIGRHALEQENSRLWYEYYATYLAYRRGGSEEAIAKTYQTITRSDQIEPKLRAYALCDWGRQLSSTEWLSKPGIPQQALQVTLESLQLLEDVDRKLVANFRTLARIYRRQGDWNKAEEYIQKIQSIAQRENNIYELVYAYRANKEFYFQRGDWSKALQAYTAGLDILSPQMIAERVQTVLPWQIGMLWLGRYAETEHQFAELLPTFRQMGGDNPAYIMYAGLSLGMQGKYRDAQTYFGEAYEKIESIGLKKDMGVAVTSNLKGIVLFRQGQVKESDQQLKTAHAIREQYQDYFGLPETLIPLAHLAEVQHNWQEAANYYQQTLDLKTGRLYFESGAYTGLVRVYHATGDYAAIPDVFTEAESLAQQYEYNDHLASLRLSQGHIAWDGQIPAWGSGFDAALAFYQQSLIYTLRYNRFLLDEVLWGGNVTTPLQPIVPHCQQRGDEGQRMLSALRDWWQTGVNDSGTPRPDTISLVPEGVTLREAERIARANEPGDGSPQRDVVAVLGGVT